MKDVTKLLLKDIGGVEWFHAAGAPFEDLPEAIVAKDWKEAVKKSRSKEWIHIQNVMREYFWIDLTLISPARADEWNSLVDEISPIVKELVERKTATTVTANNLPNEFIECVQWDIQNALMEGEYLDIRATGFFLGYVINVYHKGHFPCGWINGEPPYGRPIIF